MSDDWAGRGAPWEYDGGPPRGRRWARLFAATPDYRSLGQAALGREKFRWHFGPMFYRGRLGDGQVRVLVIGQEGAQDESLSRRSFTGGTGGRMQHFLQHLGITRSYLFLNTFVYPIYGQYHDDLRPLAQDDTSEIVQHRHALFDYVLERNDVHLVVAVGRAAKDTVVSWVASHGGTCRQGAHDLSDCDGRVLGAHTRIVGVVHPGAAARGGGTEPIRADFQRAADRVRAWADEDPDWLPPDADGERALDRPFVYAKAPIPFRDFPFGTTWRLGRGSTSSNRQDGQRSIQLFSAGGRYAGRGARLQYDDLRPGDVEGYHQAPDDRPYEPPRSRSGDYDRGPGSTYARLLMGGAPGLPWPDFSALGAPSHPSLGWGPVFRGRPHGARVIVLADQQSHDDLFTGRALTGEAGQRFQRYLEAIGVGRRYVVLRVLPVDTLGADPAVVRRLVTDARTVALHRAVLRRVLGSWSRYRLVLTLGPHARDLFRRLDLTTVPHVHLKAWCQPGAVSDWRRKLDEIRACRRRPELTATWEYDGGRGQIPREDLPFGTLRWYGTSGDRAARAFDLEADETSWDYYKMFVPDWTSHLAPGDGPPVVDAGT